jgi:hypothetical protein
MVKQLSDVYQVAEVDGSSSNINILIRLYAFVNAENFDAENLQPEMFKSDSLSRIETIMNGYFGQSFTIGDPRGLNQADGLWLILGNLIPRNIKPEITPLVENTKLLYDSSGFGTTGEKTISYIKINADGSVDQVIKESVVDLDDSTNRYLFMSIHDLSTEIKDRDDLDSKLGAYYAAGSEEAAHALPTGDPKHWNTEKVSNYDSLFVDRISTYHPKLDNWTMTQAISMKSMFSASNYNHDLNCLERTLPTPSTLGNMKAMERIFYKNRVFNNGQADGESSNPLLWKTNSAETMMFMFGTDGSIPSIFNQRLGDNSETYFNTSKVKNMHGMFRLCVDFNQSISHFKTGNVDDSVIGDYTGMKEMFFGATSFNNGGDICIGDLDVSKVDNFKNMFFGAVNFDQPINSWTVKGTATLTDMVKGSGLYLNDAYNQGFKDLETPTVDLFGKESMCVIIPLENVELKALVYQLIMNRSALTYKHTELKDYLENIEQRNVNVNKSVKDNGLMSEDIDTTLDLLSKRQQPWQISKIGSEREFQEERVVAFSDEQYIQRRRNEINTIGDTVIGQYTDLISYITGTQVLVKDILSKSDGINEDINQLIKLRDGGLDLSSSDKTYVDSFIASLEAELLEIQETVDLEKEISKIPEIIELKIVNLQNYKQVINNQYTITVYPRTYPTKEELIDALDKWYEIANELDVETANSYVGPEYIGNPKFWDVANIDDMSSVFDKKTGDKHPDISLWDVTNVTTMENMFNGSTFDNKIPLVKRKDEDITVRVTLEDIKSTANINNKIIENDGLQNAIPDQNILNEFMELVKLGMISLAQARQISILLSQLTSALKITNIRTNEELDLTIGNNITPADIGITGPTDPGVPYPIKIVKEFTMKANDILQIKTGDAFNDDIHFTIEEVVTDTIEKPRLYYSRTGIPAENLDLEIKMPSAWNTKNVTTMKGMFKGGTFNQDIGSWDVCNVRDFSEMFKENEKFDNDGMDAIDSWFYKRC